MHHVAIMRKSWGLTEKILSGEKKIESRWYMKRQKPWDKIKTGDVVYFKNSGEPVKIQAEVSDVKQFSGLTPGKVKELLDMYGHLDGIEKSRFTDFFRMFKDKKYCILVFLKNVQEVEPFHVDKRGFGAMAAWIAVKDVNNIRK